MEKERRLSPRVRSGLPLDIYDARGRAVVGEGRFLNLSESGGLLETRKRLKRRDRVRLHIVSGKVSALELAARVIWARKKARLNAYGLQFLRTASSPAVALS